MKVVTVPQFGGPEVLELREVPDPRPAPGEVLICIEAIGVGYVDVMAREGRYQTFPTPGFVPGLEIAGRIIEISATVDPALQGRRVFVMPMTGGGYAELITVPADQLIPLPDGLTARDAVGLGMNAMVAKVALERATLASGESALIRGAGGGIGIMALQVCAARGAHVTVTTSSAARADRLRELGADSVIDRRAPTGPNSDSFDVILDTDAGPELRAQFGRLKSNGRYVLCGSVGGAPAADFGAGLLGIFHRSPTFFAFSLNSMDNAAIVAAGAALFRDADQSAITPVIHRTLPLTEVVSAHHEQETGEAFGKILLIP
jgi:NADPH:quinone reductase